MSGSSNTRPATPLSPIEIQTLLFKNIDRMQYLTPRGQPLPADPLVSLVGARGFEPPTPTPLFDVSALGTD